MGLRIGRIVKQEAERTRKTRRDPRGIQSVRYTGMDVG